MPADYLPLPLAKIDHKDPVSNEYRTCMILASTDAESCVDVIKKQCSSDDL